MPRPVGGQKPCDQCGRMVVKCKSNKGTTYIANIEIVTSRFADYGDRGKAIYPAHKCDQNEVIEYQATIQDQMNNGAIIKGQNVVVVKGRKVPKGTEGVVFWVKETRDYDDSIIEVRIGFKDADENVYWTNAKNVVAKAVAIV